MIPHTKDGSKSFTLIWFTVVLFFSAFIVFPLLCVFTTPTFDDFVRVLSTKQWHTAMVNTLVECICSTTLSVFTGYIFAYGVVRADIPFKKFFSIVPVVHMVTPPFVGGLAFILLAGRQGFITHTLLHLDISLYGFTGLLIAQVLCFFPIAYLISVQTLSGINPSLEQAARAMGAKELYIFFTVTLPLSLPGILSALLFIAVSVLSDFGNPLIVAGRYRVLAVEIYTQLTGWLNGGTSAVLGIILVIPSVLLFLGQNALLKKNMLKTATIGGKMLGIKNHKTPLSAKICLTIFCSIISLLIIAQALAIIAGSFQKLWGVNTDFTLDHIKSMSRFSRELTNSIVFALISAVLSTVIASVTAFIVYRTQNPLRRTLDTVIQLPAAIPGTLLGLALSIACSKSLIKVSQIKIIIAMTVSFLPFSYRVITSTYSQIRTTLDDASRCLGADSLKVLKDIIMPLSLGGLFSSFIYDFVRGVGTMSSVIFLVSFTTPLTSIKILNLAEQGDWGKAACLALILTVITFAVLALGSLVTGSQKTKIWSSQ